MVAQTIVPPLNITTSRILAYCSAHKLTLHTKYP